MNHHTFKASSQARKLKKFGILLFLIGIISLIPLLMIAHYNHPSADDFHYGLKTTHAWQETSSFTETLNAATATVKETYLTWQGNFSGIFLMSLQPSIFGENSYPIGTYLVLSVLLIGLLLFVKALFDKFLPHSNKHFLVIGLTLFVFSVQLVPFPRQSYFWYNGAIYYTFFHGLALVLYALVLQLQKSERRSRTIPLFLITVLLAFAIGGGNFVTSLQSSMLLFIYSVYLFVTKGKNRLLVTGVFAALMVALIISIVAPGNALRQEMVPTHPNMLLAILGSFLQAGLHVFKWTSLYLIGLFVLLLPYIAELVRMNTFSYKRVWLLPLCSFLLLAVSFSPPLYGLGSMPERALNIVYYLFVLLATINYFYLVGWMVNRHVPFFSKPQSPRFFFRVGSLLLLAAFIQYPDVACKEATQSLVSGGAEQYDREFNVRLQAYTDVTIKNPGVKEFSVKPSLLFVSDIGTNSEDWQNVAVANYYNKESVVLIEMDTKPE